MSKTYCRKCETTHEGMYAICPSCGYDMLGAATGVPTTNLHIHRLTEVESQWGHRSRIPMAHSDPLLDSHARGELSDGRKFVWCPFGFILSWHPGDYDNEWCAWCKEYFKDVNHANRIQ